MSIIAYDINYIARSYLRAMAMIMISISYVDHDRYSGLSRLSAIRIFFFEQSHASLVNALPQRG